jgi:hypothetical protein
MSRRREHVECRVSDVGCARPRPSVFHIQHPASDISRRAFTLAEVTLSIAITSILLLGMGGALSLAVRAVDTGDDAPARAAAASESLASLNAELAVATQISSFDAHTITLVVPDRNADGNPERIDYTWDKVGDPMLRSFNGSTPVTFIPSVQSCTPLLTQRPAAQRVESSEQVLATFAASSSSGRTHISIDTNDFAAQYVRPVLPSGAVSWKITKVAILFSQSSGNSKVFRVSITPATSALRPDFSTILASLSLTSGAISSGMQMTTSAIGPVDSLVPGKGICIVVDGISGGSVNVWYNSASSGMPFNTHYLSSADAGSTWTTPNDTDDMGFILYGTYTTMVEP